MFRTRKLQGRGSRDRASARRSCSTTWASASYTDYKARTLSYGDQRRLEIARALATDPKLIALDEPAAGMNATEKVVLRELIDRIRKDGRTILLIEHDVKLVMGLCDRVTVLDYGKQIAEGTPVRRAAQREGHRGLPRRRPQGALMATTMQHRMTTRPCSRSAA